MLVTQEVKSFEVIFFCGTRQWRYFFAKIKKYLTYMLDITNFGPDNKR